MLEKCSIYFWNYPKYVKNILICTEILMIVDLMNALIERNWFILQDVLFPYVTTTIGRYAMELYETEEFQADLEAIRHLALEEVKNDHDVVTVPTDDKCAAVDALVHNVKHWVLRDKKVSPPLRLLINAIQTSFAVLNVIRNYFINDKASKGMLRSKNRPRKYRN